MLKAKHWNHIKPLPDTQFHYITRHGWLRAAVMGANDGIISTASLLLGLVAANSSAEVLLLAGIAATVAGALSMAAGEYVSVSAQRDMEQADLNREATALAQDNEAEIEELTLIYCRRGLSLELAKEVAQGLMDHDALDAHARDELGISANSSAKPIQAALASGITFAVGASLPLLLTVLSPTQSRFWLVIGATSVALVMLAVLSARSGGASVTTAVLRILFWGLLAMGLSSLIGDWVGAMMGA